MTDKERSAEDRADYVVDSIWDLRKRTIGDWTKAITDQIKLAEQAAYERGLEEAAQVVVDAHKHLCNPVCELADKIRALKTRAEVKPLTDSSGSSD